MTGAAAGIGRVTALNFAKEGAKVAAWDVADADALADELKAAGAADGPRHESQRRERRVGRSRRRRR